MRVQRVLSAVNRIENRANLPTNVVGAVAEARFAIQFSRRGLNFGPLSQLVHILRVEDEGLVRLTAEDQHLILIELQAGNWERFDELFIGHLYVCPSLLCKVVSALPLAGVAAQLVRSAAFKHAQDQERWRLILLHLLTRHEVDSSIVHHDCSSV